jgi:hypothetical protein
MFVYYGNDYLTDVETDLPNIPPPGQPSKWARAESFTTNPTYNAGVNSPDMTVVFLDRELPFAPIPLLRQRVSNSTQFGTIVGYGGSKALTADISQVEGAGIKRTATVRLLGSPTEADYHPDDPNPGILDPAIRETLLKTDGRDPRPNSCAGDSGGPLLVEKHGKKYLAGISMWTGLFCEDYSIYTRIDPFLDFFDGELDRAGEADIVPYLECVEDTGSGLVGHFGYNNDNGLTVKIRYGSHNDFDRDRGRARPSSFEPGSNPYAFEVPFSAGQRLTWRLDPPGGATTVVRASASSPRCAPDDLGLLCSDYCHAALAPECVEPGATYANCVTNCFGNADFFNYFGCGAEWNTYLTCVGAVSSDPANWTCSVPGFEANPTSPNCEDEVNAAFSCAGY